MTMAMMVTTTGMMTVTTIPDNSDGNNNTNNDNDNDNDNDNGSDSNSTNYDNSNTQLLLDKTLAAVVTPQLLAEQHWQQQKQS